MGLHFAIHKYNFLSIFGLIGLLNALLPDSFLTYIESYFAPQLCVMRKLDLLTDEGKVDEEKMNQFFESNQAHKVKLN